MAEETSKTLECQVKVGYIYSILKHATWYGRPSPRTTKTANVCVIGDRKLNKQFKMLLERHQHSLNINLAYSAKGAHIPDCHILFIGKAASRFAHILEEVRNRPILTVSDVKGFVEKGGMIELVKVKHNGKTNIKTRVDIVVAEEKGIVLGAELIVFSDLVARNELMIITNRLH